MKPKETLAHAIAKALENKAKRLAEGHRKCTELLARLQATRRKLRVVFPAVYERLGC